MRSKTHQTGTRGDTGVLSSAGPTGALHKTVTSKRFFASSIQEKLLNNVVFDNLVSSLLAFSPARFLALSELCRTAASAPSPEATFRGLAPVAPLHLSGLSRFCVASRGRTPRQLVSTGWSIDLGLRILLPHSLRALWQIH